MQRSKRREHKEIEKEKSTSTEGMHKKIKTLTRMKKCTSSGCIEDKDGKIIVENMAIMEELFQDNRGNKPEICKNIDEPKILQLKVKATINKIKWNKAKSSDDIVIEMVQVLADFGT